MTKKIFSLFLTVLCVSLYSCSEDNPDQYDPTKDMVEIDYIVDLGYFKDLTINKKDGAVYALAYDQTATTINMSLKKISPNGSLTIVKGLDGGYLGNNMKITGTNNGKLYWTTDISYHSNEILSFSNDFSKIESISMRPASGPFAPTPQLTSILAYENNSLVVFDVAYRQLKRYYSDLSAELLMAGSEKNEIKDGIGLDAGFSFVNRILSHDGTLYVLDNFRNIRKVEKQESLPKVTTILSNYSEEIKDIAIDVDGNIYATTYNGFYILKKDANNLELISDKLNINVKTKDKAITNLNFYGIDHLYIDNNDLYLVNFGSLLKVSDFKTKLQELKNKGLL